MKPNKTSISSIVITYNPNIDVLKNQLYQLSNQCDKTIIVDNNSSNIKQIKEIISAINYSVIQLIPLDENLGLGAAQNIGIKISRAKNFDFSILFDDDSCISNNFISELISEHKRIKDKHGDISAIGPSFWDPDSDIFYPSCIYYGPFIRRINHSTNNPPIESTFIIASGCLFDNSIFDMVGLMNEDLFIDYVDVEWCLRARSLGFKCYTSNKVTMAHSVGDSRRKILGRTISVHSPLRRYYLTRNCIKISGLNYVPIGYKIREIVLCGLRFIISYYHSQKKGDTLYYFAKGVIDGFTNKNGKI